MKLKVGQKVKIREDLISGRQYGSEPFVYDMNGKQGKVARITHLHTELGEYSINLDRGKYYWTDEMFSEVLPKPAPCSMYVKTSQVTGLDELIKRDFIMLDHKVYHRGWFGQWQMRFTSEMIKQGRIFNVMKKTY